MEAQGKQIDYVWLEATGQMRKYQADAYSGLFWLLTLPLQLISLFIAPFIGFWGWTAASAFPAVFAVLSAKDYYVFYWTIKCPVLTGCGVAWSANPGVEFCPLQLVDIQFFCEYFPATQSFTAGVTNAFR